VREIRAIGIQPDLLLCRTDRNLTPEAKKKIAIHCNLDGDAVINAIDVETIYEVPLALHAEGLDHQIIRKLQLQAREADLVQWKDIVRKIKEPKNEVTIAIVGNMSD
jgi:CTP synthase